MQIDLSKAKIQDAEAGGMYAPLSDMLQISEDNGLMIDGSTKFVTDDAPDGAEFDFKFDPERGQVGCRDGVFARRLTISQESQRWQTSGFRARSSTLGP